MLVRLGERQEASDAFDRVLATHPDFDHIRADYVAALLQWGEAAHAGRVLEAAPPAPAAASANATGGNATAAVNDGGRKRLDLLRVQWLTLKGRYGEALRVLEALGARYPTDADVLVAIGRFDDDRGRTGAADRSFEAARRQAPERDDIARLLERRRQGAAPSVTVDTESQSVRGAWDEQSTKAVATGSLGGHHEVSVTVEQLRLTANRILGSGGRARAVSVDRQRVEASVTSPLADGATVTASLFGADGRAGAGATLTRRDLYGSLSVAAEFDRPFWQFPESVADPGRRDRVSVTRQMRLGADTSAWAIAGWNRYELASGPELTSGAVTFGVVRTVRRAPPSLALQYGFDMEHRYRATFAATPDGFVFAPIPLVNREVHVMAVIGRFPAALWDVEAGAGYTLDRLGGHGAFFTAHLTPKPDERVGLELWAERRRYALATTQQELRAGVSLMVRFWK